jgi:hypothetical protein
MATCHLISDYSAYWGCHTTLNVLWDSSYDEDDIVLCILYCLRYLGVLDSVAGVQLQFVLLFCLCRRTT